MQIITEETEKMKYLHSDIIASLGQMPAGKRVYLFGDEEEPDMEWVLLVANYIVFEFIKDSFDKEDPVYPLRHFLIENNADDSNRMVQSRIMQYVMKYKKRELAEKGIDPSSTQKFSN